MAEPGIPLRRTVTLISGPDAAARSACIAQLRAQRRGLNPAGEDDSLWLQAGEVPSAPLAMQSPSSAACATGAPDQTLTAGCICCLGGPVFRTTLVRLLRQPAWKHLYLEVSREGEHLLRVVDQLRQPPFDQHLRLVSLVRATGSGLRMHEGQALMRPCSAAAMTPPRAGPVRPGSMASGTTMPPWRWMNRARRGALPPRAVRFSGWSAAGCPRWGFPPGRRPRRRCRRWWKRRACSGCRPCCRRGAVAMTGGLQQGKQRRRVCLKDRRIRRKSHIPGQT